MNADQLLSNNLKYDLPFVDAYDSRYAEADLSMLESCSKDPYALFELAERYREGTKGAEVNFEKAFGYYQQVLYYQRNLPAMFWLGHFCAFYLPEHKEDCLKYLNTAYSFGSRDAARLLGLLYLDKLDVVDTDYEKAYRYLLFAKEKGIFGMDGYIGRAADHLERYDEARAYYETALLNGQKEYANYLGFMYYTGIGVEEDEEKAKEYFQTAYHYNGSGYAALMLGMILKDGTDSEKYGAYLFLKEASEKGLPKANLLLGNLLVTGIPDKLGQNYDSALEYYLHADTDDLGRAYYMISLIYAVRGNWEAKLNYLFRSAETGFLPAVNDILESDQITLRYSLNSGMPVVTEYDDRYDRADFSAVLAAGETDPAAMYELAARYRLGEQGAPQDNEKAKEYFKKVLIHQRHARAYYWMGRILCDGNPPMAQQIVGMDYFKAAYSLGSVEAAMNIGVAYETGATEGYAKDLDKALEYYLYAKEHGHTYADASIGGIYEAKGNTELAIKHYEYGIAADDPYAMFDLGTYYLNHDKAAEGISLMKRAAAKGLLEAEKVLSVFEENGVQEIIESYEEAFKNVSREGGFQKLVDIVFDARRLFPDNPDVLIRFITVGNITAYGKKMKKADYAYETFSEMLRLLQKLKKNAPDRITGEIKKQESFCCTHLADLALARHEDGFAETLLRSADRTITPFSAVVMLEYLHKQASNEETAKNAASMSELKQKMKTEAEILRITIEQPADWNTPTERYLGYTMLEILYRDRTYEPYIMKDKAFARKCREKAGQLYES